MKQITPILMIWTVMLLMLLGFIWSLSKTQEERGVDDIITAMGRVK